MSLTQMRSKQRSQLEVLQVNALMQRFQYCRDMITKEGFEKYNKFCEFLYTIYCRTGERVIRKGQQGVRFYMILQGQVSLVSYKPKNRKAQLLMDQEKDTVSNYEDDTLFSAFSFKELNPGDYFGDMSLLDNGQVSCTIICKTFCQFVCMDKQQFVKFIGKSVPMLQKLKILEEQSIFNCWTDGELRALSYEFKNRTYHQEEYLYQEGQRNVQVFLLMDGQIEMTSTRDNQSYHLSSLDVGALFGDDTDYHTCNAKCVSARADVLLIGRQVLSRMLDWHPESKQLYRQQLQYKVNWRQERLNNLIESHEDKTKVKRTQSIKMQLLDLLIKPKYQKIRLSPCVKRVTNIQDIMDFEEKKLKHKEILEKQNLVISQRKIEFFKLGLTFTEKRRKKQKQQQAELNSKLQRQCESVIILEPPLEKLNRASSTIMTKTSQNTFKLSPTKKHRKVFSIEGTTINIHNRQ
ncbi:unnamed protein product [Paramecium pentaurelia]|uniref:Cyclic nucleotide-binding domain-containing protein n=1 Tax=Paramecium pentaurelia TaxID=43138 RepID=A0A8S1YBC6_9CILI|nr:unnamed protein product [Paramecium pentaurelia]